VTTTVPAAEKTSGNSGDHAGIVSGMAQIQVFLPDELYEEAQALGLRLEDILERPVETAVRAELHLHQQVRASMEAYVAELSAEVGEPSAEEAAWADGIIQTILDHRASMRKQGS
jgi:hypothetical protein